MHEAVKLCVQRFEFSSYELSLKENLWCGSIFSPVIIDLRALGIAYWGAVRKIQPFQARGGSNELCSISTSINFSHRQLLVRNPFAGTKGRSPNTKQMTLSGYSKFTKSLMRVSNVRIPGHVEKYKYLEWRQMVQCKLQGSSKLS